MNPYFGLFKISIQDALVYKFYFFTQMFKSIVTLFVFYYLWSAIFANSGATVIGGLTLVQMLTYALMSETLRNFLQSHIDNDVGETVRWGYASTLLSKPVDFQAKFLSEDLGTKLFDLLICSLPSFIVAVIIFNISIPSLLVLPFFFISIFLGYLVAFQLTFLTGIVAFWTSYIWGFRHFRKAIESFFSGSFIPLYLFPVWLRKIAELMPFKAIFHIPLSIYIGKIAGDEIFLALIEQLFWLLVVFVIVRGVWFFARKEFTSQGG